MNRQGMLYICLCLQGTTQYFGLLCTGRQLHGFFDLLNVGHVLDHELLWISCNSSGPLGGV